MTNVTTALACTFGLLGSVGAFENGPEHKVPGDTLRPTPSLRQGTQPQPSGAAVDGDPVDLGTGLYVRTHVDLAVWDTVPIIFSRTYRNRDDRSRPFGVGTNHSYGSFLVGDSDLAWADLIRPDGGRIHYRRTSPGTGLNGARFENTDSPTEYLHSTLSYDGDDWTIQMTNGGRFTYPECSPAMNKACTVSGYQNPAGHRLRFVHDAQFNLSRVETEHGYWLQLAYDAQDRIIRAWTNYGDEVRYTYDTDGRLIRVIGANGDVSEYEYNARNEMVMAKEPDLLLRNEFDESGRCIRQELRTSELGASGQPVERQTAFTFAYTTDARGRITAADVVRPNGTRRHVTFNAQGYVSSETVSGDGIERGVAYTRDDENQLTRTLTVSCGPGQRVRVASAVRRDEAQRFVSAPIDFPSGEDTLKARLDRTCEDVLATSARRRSK